MRTNSLKGGTLTLVPAEEQTKETQLVYDDDSASADYEKQSNMSIDEKDEE